MGDLHRWKRNAGGIGALLSGSGFLVAVLTAGGAAVLAFFAGRRRIGSIAQGIAAGVAVIVGLAAEDVLPAALPFGLLLLAGAALLSEGRPLAVRVAALSPGAAVMVTLAAEGTTGWARAVAFIAIVGAGSAAATFDRGFPYLTFALLGVSVLGAYATVPDTEQARALVGALLPVGALALVCRGTPEPSSPSMVVALIAWVALVGGVGRPGSVVGAIGCLGVVALGRLSSRCSPLFVAAVHVPVVAIASRVAGLRQSALAAAAVLLLVLVVAAAVLLSVGERSPKADPP